jgi:rare lipoprotein A
VIAAVAAAVVLGAGGTVAWARSGGTPDTHRAAAGASRSAASEAAASPVPSTSGDAGAQRAGEDRASRDEMRANPIPSKSPSKSPSKPPSKDPGGGTVTSKGTCGASFYDTGSRTANGEPFNPDGITAAHKTLAFNTRVRVTNRANGKSVVVRINDRGPFVAGRCLDLSRGAFKEIASLSAGVLTVDYEVLA